MIELEGSGKLHGLPPHREAEEMARQSALERIALRMTGFAERWFPDAYVIALIAMIVVCIAALAIGASPDAIVGAIGDGYWKLNNFTYQMALVVMTGFAFACSAPVRRAIRFLAGIPKTGPGAVMFIIVLSIGTNLVHWGFGMMFSVFLTMAATARKDLRLDARAAAAAGMLGNTMSMVGLSSSAALLHATPASLPPELLKLSGIIPLSETVLQWQNAVVIIVTTLTAVFVGYATTPRGNAVVTAADMGIDTGRLFDIDSNEASDDDNVRRPGDFLSNSPLLTIIVSGLMAAWVVMKIMSIGFGATISNLNNYLFISLGVALILHWRIRLFLKAMMNAVPAVGGILLQFPIYAAAASVLMLAHNPAGHSLAHYMGEFFASVVSKDFLPMVVGLYSIIVSIFIPSAGAKWMVEAPYILHAGNEVGSHLGWLINTYGGSEALANLLNPFWMLPMVGLLKMRVRSVVGFTFMYFVFMTPVMIVAFWLLGYTLQYHPIVMP